MSRQPSNTHRSSLSQRACRAHFYIDFCNWCQCAKRAAVIPRPLRLCTRVSSSKAIMLTVAVVLLVVLVLLVVVLARYYAWYGQTGLNPDERYFAFDNTNTPDDASAIEDMWVNEMLATRPDSSYRGEFNRWANARHNWRRISARALGRSAGSARPTNQGRSGTCVRHALAAAIKDQAEAKLKKVGSTALRKHGLIDLMQEAIVVALMQHVKHAKGMHPTEFSGWEGTVSDTHGRWYTIKMNVDMDKRTVEQARVAFYFFRDVADVANRIQSQLHKETYVMSYDTQEVHGRNNGGRHCVYLQGIDMKQRRLIGMNSWGETDPNPRIRISNMASRSVTLYRVRIVRILLLAGSAGCRRDELLFGESETAPNGSTSISANMAPTVSCPSHSLTDEAVPLTHPMSTSHLTRAGRRR